MSSAEQFFVYLVELRRSNSYDHDYDHGDRVCDIDIDVVLCCRRSNPAGSSRSCAPPATSTHSRRLLGCGGSRVGISTNDHRDHHDDSDYLPVHR